MNRGESISHDVLQWASTANLSGNGVCRIAQTRWGYSTPTVVVTLMSGSRLVIQAFDDAGSARRTIEGGQTLKALGIQVPRVASQATVGDRTLVITDYIADPIGADLIGTQRATGMAAAMARVGRLMRRQVADGPVPGPWASRDSLLQAVSRWSEFGSTNLIRHITRCAAQVTTTPWKPALSHGDFVPANVLVAPAGELTLLDTGDVSYRHPLLDSAWWLLVVRHHHAHEYRALAESFLAAADLTDASRSSLIGLALLRCLELIAAAPPGHASSLEALARSAAAWVSPRGILSP